MEQYTKIIPNLAISETSELKDRIQKQVIISDRKVGELEHENVSLQDRLDSLESSYDSLKDILEDIILARARQ